MKNKFSNKYKPTVAELVRKHRKKSAEHNATIRGLEQRVVALQDELSEERRKNEGHWGCALQAREELEAVVRAHTSDRDRLEGENRALKAMLAKLREGQPRA